MKQKKDADSSKKANIFFGTATLETWSNSAAQKARELFDLKAETHSLFWQTNLRSQEALSFWYQANGLFP